MNICGNKRSIPLFYNHTVIDDLYGNEGFDTPTLVTNRKTLNSIISNILDFWGIFWEFSSFSTHLLQIRVVFVFDQYWHLNLGQV